MSNQTQPSSNWLALQKKLKPSAVSNHDHVGQPRKKRKLEPQSKLVGKVFEATISSFPRGSDQPGPSSSATPIRHATDDALHLFKSMVVGEITFTLPQQQPGKYLAMDCEMVGVGIDGTESSLARVSIVNYYGAIQMDEFVRQKERVMDYRTAVSGVRPQDMISAKSFEDVQKRVAQLLKDRILVGHAVHNDLKALLLSHPRPSIRDTQVLARKHNLTKSLRPALRHLVQQELGLSIQGGEHSSIIDARATMAIYRLHRKSWEKVLSLPPQISGTVTAKRKLANSERSEGDDDRTEVDEDDQPSTPRSAALPSRKKVMTSAGGKTSKEQKKRRDPPGGGRKGVSSGLSTVVKRKESKTKKAWWKDLGGSKSSVKL